MKKLLLALLVLTLVLMSSAMAEKALVNTPEELTAALMNDAVDAIEIAADMTVTDSYVMQTKDITILSDVVFQPAPDEGFFVKSWEIPEGVTLTVKGKVTTVHTFEDGFVIAQFYLNGGTMDIGEGMVSDDCNICFNAGTLVAPAAGFGPDVEVARYLYMDVTEDTIAEALAQEGLRNATVQAECTIEGSLVVPEGKVLEISSVMTLMDGAAVEGDIIVDAGCGVILKGSSRFNDMTVPEGMEACKILWAEDGSCTVLEYSETPVSVTIGEWVEAKGLYSNCMLTVTVKEIINPALARVEDETGEVNLYGLQINGDFFDIAEAGVKPGDVLTLSNPKYNVYDGVVEMSDAMLMTEE